MHRRSVVAAAIASGTAAVLASGVSRGAAQPAIEAGVLSTLMDRIATGEVDAIDDLLHPDFEAAWINVYDGTAFQAYLGEMVEGWQAAYARYELVTIIALADEVQAAWFGIVLGKDAADEVVETTAIGWGAVLLDGVIGNLYPLQTAYVLDPPEAAAHPIVNASH